MSSESDILCFLVLSLAPTFSVARGSVIVTSEHVHTAHRWLTGSALQDQLAKYGVTVQDLRFGLLDPKCKPVTIYLQFSFVSVDCTASCKGHAYFRIVWVNDPTFKTFDNKLKERKS